MCEEKKSESVNVPMQAFKVNISPFTFHLYSEQYLVAARAIPISKEFSPVPYHLYGISAELALKSFLSAKGIKKEELKEKFRHNLDTLLSHAEKLDLQKYISYTAKEREQISLLNAYYKPRYFEYFKLSKALKGFPGMPSISTLDQFLSRMLTSIKQLTLPK